MQLPQYFIEKATRTFGAEGVEWVSQVPAILRRCQERWQLSNVVPVDDLSINLVCFADSAQYGKTVLKIEGPHDVKDTEIEALLVYGGHFACQCFAVDFEVSTMLLERVVPGTTLRSLDDKQAQLEIGAELISKLPVSAAGLTRFPTYADWIAKAFHLSRTRFNASERMCRLMALAEEVFREIDADPAPKVLLHGDLHHDNILQDGDGSWKAIDPQGAIGAPSLETARFIQNHVDWDDSGNYLADVDRTVAHFAAYSGKSKWTIAGCLFILHLLSSSWGQEMNYEQERINKGVEECEHLLRYLNKLPYDKRN